MSDTSPEALEVQVQAWRHMRPEQRLRLACEMSDSVRRVAAAGVKRRHPHYTHEQVRLAVIRMSLGDELYRACYPSREAQGVRP